MKPTNDLFEQQVKGLYEGHEVPAPASTKDAVFKKLDAAKSTGSLSFSRKAVLVAVSILSIGAAYWILNQSSTITIETQAETKPDITKEVVKETPEVIENVVSDETKVKPVLPDRLPHEPPVDATPASVEEPIEEPKNETDS